MSSAFLIPTVRKYGSIFQGMAAAPLPPLEGGARMTTDADEIVARVLEEVADAWPADDEFVRSLLIKVASLRDPKALRERSSPAAPLPAGRGLELYTQGYDDMWQATIYKRIPEAEAVIKAARDLIDDPALGSVAGWYDSVTHLRHFLSALPSAPTAGDR